MCCNNVIIMIILKVVIIFYKLINKYNNIFLDEHYKILWGLDGTSQFKTVQGYDYVNSNDPNIYSKPDYLFLFQKIKIIIILNYVQTFNKFKYRKNFQTNLIFVAGPNIKDGSYHGSMTRTKNKEASINDDFFIQGVIVALYKGIKKMC